MVAVKAGALTEVESYIIKNRYIVYDFDHVLFLENN